MKGLFRAGTALMSVLLVAGPSLAQTVNPEERQESLQKIFQNFNAQGLAGGPPGLTTENPWFPGEPAHSPEEAAEAAEVVQRLEDLERSIGHLERTARRHNSDPVKVAGRTRDVVYGGGAIRITCLPGLVCSLHLAEEGEVVIKTVMGNAEAWGYEETFWGVPGRETGTISFMGPGWDQETNAFVFTTERLYLVHLRIPEKPKDKETPVSYDELINVVLPPSISVIQGTRPRHVSPSPGPVACEKPEEQAAPVSFVLRAPGRKKRLNPDWVRVTSRGERTRVEISSEMKAKLGAWPLIETYLGDELVPANAVWDDVTSAYLLGFVPTKIKIFHQTGKAQKYLMAERRDG